jgi:hypothetical protein
MPFTVDLDEEELQRLEEDGGLNAATLKDRDRTYELFLQYFEKEAEGVQIDIMLSTEEGKKDFGKIFSR